MKRTAYLGCSLLMTAALAIPTVAVAQSNSLDEGTAYANFYAEQDCKAKAALGEGFYSQYKTSQYADPVFRQTVNCYFKLNNAQKVIELAGKTDQLFPDMKPADKANVYGQAMQVALNNNNAAQAITFGEKVLSIAPDDLNTLMVLSSTISYSTPKDAAAIAKAEGYAKKGLETLGKVDGKSFGISDAEWAKQKVVFEGQLHATLGGIYFNKQDYDHAVEELMAATKAVPKDGTSWYLLGLSYNQQYTSQMKPYQEAVQKSNDAIKSKDQALIEEGKAVAAALAEVLREKRDQAIDALATAVACGGTTQQPAMDQLKKLYANKNNGSVDGLEQLINSKKPAQ